ncbi:isoleucine--tRNA ligase [Persicobacter psychrovividus]|uniref:Isoleucine--tRNA ligase n=1 Tax=Persicobacter psychrovividus TaxID=387638 RepID=A0ABM7VI14_9BACT|nr:isoleucine--tRNA ligase [Persicobacter psychrovividus]
MQYKEYKQVDFAQVGRDVLQEWKDKSTFDSSVKLREGAPEFVFFEGPPSANGTPGIHHVMARTVKDIFCRYKTLKGFQVKRKGGWDTHGLPVELQVEKELGITKEDIGKTISVEEYNQRCRESVMKFKDEWDDLTEKMGYWVDLDDPYITFDRNYMQTLWSLLKKLYDKGLLYKGYTIQPFSPAAGTGLSSHELNQPGTYRDVKDTSITAQFKIKGTENEFFLAWTTTPWTLSSNAALAVGKNIDYVKVRTFNPYTFEPIFVILAKNRFNAYFNPKHADLKIEDYNAGDKGIPYEVVDTFKGSELVGRAYEQLMPYVQPVKDADKAFHVIEGDFVTTEDGTGIVHIAPTFGADDQRVAFLAGVPAITVLDEKGNELPLVDKTGRFVKEMGEFGGQFVKAEYEPAEVTADKGYKSIDVLISIKLKEENRAFKVEKYEHSYPHCWRTDKPILYYPLDSWFIKTTEYKEQLVALNKTINWKPGSTGSGRFGNWLENLVDWNLSRSRYWGTPLPIWRTEDGEEEICIGSIAELAAEVEKAKAAGFMEASLPEDFDLHRPYVDDVFLVSASGKKMFREPDLIDVWFDSGAMPYAQWGVLADAVDANNPIYTADFIAEGVDQTRGWFFTLHALSTMLYDKVAFKNVIANGLVLDKNGNKMSKRLGNGVNPFETIDTHGPDATRWYMISNANPWDNLKFDIDGVMEVKRKLFGTLQNTYNFFALYANLDGFVNNGEVIPVAQRTESDRWIISRLNSLIKVVDENLNAYEPTRAARAIQDFVTDDMSNWYVRLNRKRFWKGEFNEDKKAAYQTLHECLTTIAQISAPFAPFYMDTLYQNLTAGIEGAAASVHLTNFPTAVEADIDADLEARMTLAQQASSLVHSLRKKEKIKVRQPLQRVMIPALNDTFKAHIAAVEEIIKNEVNVKEVEVIDDTSGILVKNIKPNFKTLGKAYGPRMKDIAKAISAFEQEDIAKIEADGQYVLAIEGGDVTLTLEDVLITSQDIPGWLVANEGALTVALDINLNDALKEEGLARDLVNRIQNIRKDMGLEIQDKIQISIQNEETIAKAVASNEAYITTETQATALAVVDQLNDATALDIDGLTVNLKVSK